MLFRNTTRLHIRFAFVVALSALLLLSPFPLAARQLRIEDFHADIAVLPDGSIVVTEKIQAHFIGGPWHGLYRTIPVEYVTPQGLNFSLLLTVKSVTDASGRSLKCESSRERHYRKLKIFIPEADNSTQNISIEYTVASALRFFEDHDEFYWNVTGDLWDIPIESASATVTLPADTSNIRVNPFTGVYRSRSQDADVNITSNLVEVRTREPLRLHEGLTIAVAFDKGFVHEPSAAQLAWLYLRSNWPFGLPILTFFFMSYLWWTRGRDPRHRPITTQYEPPDQLTPGEAGTLVDNSANMRDITATLVDLAVRGYILIEEIQKEQLLGLMHHKDYKFMVQKDRSEWSKLKPHEQVLLNGLFDNGTVGESVTMTELENHFYQNLPSIRSRIFEALLARGYYTHRPDSVRAAYIGAGFVIGVLGILAGSWLGVGLGMAPLTFILAGVLTGGIICAFGWFMPAHTQGGMRALEDVLGFEDFLVHVESDRFNRMIKTPQMFEKFLPFAMALGVEKNWSKAFQGILTQPPEWYRGASYSPSFYPTMFMNDLSYMSSRASSVMSSAPRSSGGSGFGDGGGGGSSGGGFGGGGGGGF
jgi:hypothetical protein